MYYTHIKYVFLLLILLFGCIQNVQNPKSFELGVPFDISQNETLFNQEANLTIKVISFENSICPADVVCIWEGELGINLHANSETIYLGTKTRKEVIFSSYKIELLSIDYALKKATLRITKISTPSTTWVYYDPVQCNGNPWQTWDAYYISQIFETDNDRLMAWLYEQGIQAREIRVKVINEVVCLACNCPRGDRIAVLIDSVDKIKMDELGWMTIACTKEAKICPDGSIVGRMEPFCDFENCPIK